MLLYIVFVFRVSTVAASFGNSSQECGIRYEVNRYEPAIVKGSGTRHNEYPWHVALYRQYNTADIPEYICGGSIILPKVVLTAAHCFYNETLFKIDNGKYTVVAGKYYSSWELRDPTEQRLEVKEIAMPQTYFGFRNRFADDIALITMNDSFTTSSVIMPVCIDWNSEFNFFQETVFGTVVGWGVTENGSMSSELQLAKLKYYDFEKCRDKVSDGFSSFVTSDKFCAGLDNGTAVDHGDSGGGITFPHNTTDQKERYYLYGIVSTKDTFLKHIAAFTDIRSHLAWLNRTLLSIIDPSKLDSCAPLASNSVSLVNCSLNGTSVDCSKYAKIGTKANLQCKSSYHSESPFRLYLETECSKNKSWLPLVESCIDCGKKYKFNTIVPLVKYRPRTVSEYPWHAGFYAIIDHYKEYRNLCGSSIIHPKAVLTAAHCLYSSRSNPHKYKGKTFIVAGKYKSNWTEDSSLEQKIEIKRVHVHPHFFGRSNHNANDIAILELQKAMNFSNYIMPACIDWTGDLNLYDNPLSFGTAPGWGITEDGAPSDELRAAKLPFIERKKCQELLKTSELPFLTQDKFCAGSRYGEALSRGDSGGSLTFPKYNSETGEETHYVYGITSNGGLSVDYITLFSNVTYHLQWIKTVLMSIVLNE